jgi:hypothetical protein
MAVSQTIQEKMLEEAYSATPNYDIDPNDKRFTAVNEQKDAALKELDATYAGMIGQTNQYYDDQIAALDKWEDKQTEIQNAQTDFTIQQIEQQKDKAHKDYLKEQSGAYVDWQKQSNQYGAKAEQMASSGLTNTGFAESSQVAMYNTYQNRVATARESYNNAVLNYNNSIKEAQLANSAALAEIAFTTLQKQLELSLAGFQYKNQLILEQANKKLEVDNMYWNRYQDVLQQINTENAMKEDIRQYNESMKWQTEQAELDRTFKSQEAELDRKFEAEQAKIQRDFQSAQAELERKHDKEMLAAETKAAKEKLQKQHELEMAQLKKEQEYKMAQLDKQLASEKALAKYKYDLEHPTYGYVGDNDAKVAAMPKTKYGALHNTNPAIKYNPVKTYTPSASVKKKINSLSLMRNQSGSKKAIANSICVYYAQGQISEQDAVYMFKHFGYNPDDYLE